MATSAILEGRLAILQPGAHHGALRSMAVYRRVGRLAPGLAREVRFYSDGRRRRPPVDCLWLPRGLLPRVRELVPDLRVYDARVVVPEVGHGWRGQLRPEQADAVWRLYRQGGGVLVAPPAAGKTESGLALVACWRQPALWLAHTRDLVDQAVDRAQRVLQLPRGGLGVIGAGRGDTWGTHLTVATIQSLARKRYAAESRIGAVVHDECHHSASPSWARVLNRMPARYRLGLTATPERTDGLHPLMYDLLGRPVVIPFAQMVALGRALMPSIEQLDTQFRCSPGADWNRIQEERATDPQRNFVICALAYGLWRAGHRVIVLVERIEHTRLLAAALGALYHCPASAVSGPVASLTRKQAFGALAEERRVLVATKLLDEGVDLPLADRLILGAAQRSEPLLWQRVGRVIRAPAGKADAVVWDLIDPLVPSLLDQAEQREGVYRALGFPVRKRHAGMGA